MVRGGDRDRVMSVFDKVLSGEAKEFKAIINGKEQWVVETNGRFFYRCIAAGRHLPIAKSKVTHVMQAGRVVH